MSEATRLPFVDLKTKLITFDDRMQQVRVIAKHKGIADGKIDFLEYRDDDGFFYLKKYRSDWAEVIRV